MKENTCFERYVKEMEVYVEREFLAGHFENIFPQCFDLYEADGANSKYGDIAAKFGTNLVKKVVLSDSELSMSEEAKKDICKQLKGTYHQIPFFKMAGRYQARFFSNCCTSEGNYYLEFNRDPFYAAWADLAGDCSDLGLSDEFVREAGLDAAVPEEDAGKWFALSWSGDRLSASCWYKLGVQAFLLNHIEHDSQNENWKRVEDGPEGYTLWREQYLPFKKIFRKLSRTGSGGSWSHCGELPPAAIYMVKALRACGAPNAVRSFDDRWTEFLYQKGGFQQLAYAEKP